MVHVVDSPCLTHKKPTPGIGTAVQIEELTVAVTRVPPVQTAGAV